MKIINSCKKVELTNLKDQQILSLTSILSGFRTKEKNFKRFHFMKLNLKELRKKNAQKINYRIINNLHRKNMNKLEL